MMFSPYPWHYTLRWPYYYRFPSHRNHTGMPIAPDSHLFYKDKSTHLRLMFCGDIMVQHQDIPPVLHPTLCALIKSADFFIGNCEAPLGNHYPDKNIKYGFSFHMPRRFLEDIIYQTGLDASKWILSTANNHIGDKGYFAYDQTYDILADMKITALGRYKENNLPMNVIETNGMRIGFIAWTEWLNRPIFENDEGVNRQKHILAHDWRQIKNTYQLNYLFGLPHWEYEFQHFPCQKTRSLARNLINDKGIDFIIGAHTHTLQSIEWFEEGVCAYNLGNFCGFAAAATVKLIPILEVNLSKEGNNPLHSYKIHYFYQHKIANQYHIIPLHMVNEKDKVKLLKLMNRLYGRQRSA